LLTLLLFSQAALARQVTVTVDDRPLDCAAFVEAGVTYVHLVPLMEALGGSVTWDGGRAAALAELPLCSLELPAGRDYLLADGAVYPLTAPTLLREGRTYVPLRSVANLLGADVTFSGWEQPIAVTRGAARSYTDEDLYWLSRVISAESRGEDLIGQIAVGNVVLNRIDSEEFPDTVRSVVFDTRNAVQFEPTANGTIYLAPTQQSVLAARLALAGADAVGDCLYFFNPSLSQGAWIRQNRPYHATIGCHRFYR